MKNTYRTTSLLRKTGSLVVSLALLGLASCGGGGGDGDSGNGGSTPTPTTFQMGGARQGIALNVIGSVTTFAGSGAYGSTDGTGAMAQFRNPEHIATDGTYLYVADTSNDTIRKIVVATGEVSTLAGAAFNAGSADGAGATAQFTGPRGVTTDGAHLYIADTGNSTIRKIVIATGAVTTLAGTALTQGSTDGTGTNALFNDPTDVTTDGTNLYVVDTNNATIRKIVIATGVVTTLAGTVLNHGYADGTGTAALFNYPYGIATDGSNLYVAEFGNHTIRRIVIATGDVTTLAGTAGSAGSTDGTGIAALFSNPGAITTDGANLYVADTASHTVRRIAIGTRVVTTLAGTPGSQGATDGTGSAARFSFPAGVTTNGQHLFVSSGNSIRVIQ